MSSTERFRDKIAIVTGGASGIGKALVDLLRAQGATVTVFDSAVPHGDIVDGATHVDVTSEESVAAAVARVVDRFG